MVSVPLAVGPEEMALKLGVSEFLLGRSLDGAPPPSPPLSLGSASPRVPVLKVRILGNSQLPGLRHQPASGEEGQDLGMCRQVRW